MGYLGENIKRERVRAGFDQARLAHELGLDQTAISRFENGSRRPSVDLLKRIAGVLGCDFSALVGENDPNRDLVETFLAENPEIRMQLRSLASHRGELAPEDWQFLADHITHAFSHVEQLRERMKRKG